MNAQSSATSNRPGPGNTGPVLPFSRRGFIGSVTAALFFPWRQEAEKAFADVGIIDEIPLGEPELCTLETFHDDAFVPERWAAEALAILCENLVSTHTIARDLGYPARP